ncbi:MAG: ATP-grasp domain-containing protein, partial [Cyanobacteria bacterium J06632_3]
EIRDIEAVQPGEFFKPLESQQKLFLPRVKDRSFQCELLLDKIPAGTRVWVSSAVSFLAEYRVYVRRGQVLNVCFYKGDPLIQPEVGAIAAMVSATKSCAVAYAIDVGVLESGETALVELSDFCCLGNYGLKAIDYAACIAERWAEVWQDT